MKQDRFEDYIRKHRDIFDDAAPPPESWDDILHRLDAPPKVRRLRNHWLMRAAAVLLIFALSWVVHDFVNSSYRNQPRETTNVATLPPQVSELLEAEAFYTSRIEELKIEVIRFDNRMPGIAQVMELELSELDSAYAGLRRDLKDQAANEEIINAMIQNYRIRIAILEDLLLQLSSGQSDPEERKEASHVL